MARTPLFRKLQQLFESARHPPPTAAAPLPRRQFVQEMLAGLTTLAAGCSHSGALGPTRPASATPRIAIIGAGLAGLTCAYRLHAAGVDATIYEASNRVGGRTLSTTPGRFPNGQIAELGGEFIDSNHLTLLSLMRELDLQLCDRAQDIAQHGGREIWWLDGAEVPLPLLIEQFRQLAPIVAEHARGSEQDPALFARLDQTSLHAWLHAHAAQQPQLLRVLEIAYRGEYGLEIAEQSSLNLLSMIGYDAADEFRVFGDSDERYRCASGNQAIATRLAQRLQAQIRFGQKLLAVEGDAHAGYRLQFAGTEARAEQVVFALPFSVLRQVDLSQLSLTAHKRRVIKELGYGTHAKRVSAFARRTWREDSGASAVSSDLPIQQLWDTSIAQPGSSGLLTTFLAGHAGLAAHNADNEAWAKQVLLTQLPQIFPAIARDYLPDSTLQMHWPSQPTSLGSYACYRPGQWAFAGTEGLPEAEGTLHFCGEHASVDFQGFMEGAAESGALVAGALLKQLGVEPTPVHHALLQVKRALPQPAFGEHQPVRKQARLACAHSALRQLALSGPRGMGAMGSGYKL